MPTPTQAPTPLQLIPATLAVRDPPPARRSTALLFLEGAGGPLLSHALSDAGWHPSSYEAPDAAGSSVDDSTRLDSDLAWTALQARLRVGEFTSVFARPPASTFGAQRHALRSVDKPYGLSKDVLSPRQAEHVRKGTFFALKTFEKRSRRATLRVFPSPFFSHVIFMGNPRSFTSPNAHPSRTSQG